MSRVRCLSAVWLGLAQGWLVTSPLVDSAIGSGSALPEPIADATARLFFWFTMQPRDGTPYQVPPVVWHQSTAECHIVFYTTVEGVKKLFVLRSMMLREDNKLYAVD